MDPICLQQRHQEGQAARDKAEKEADARLWETTRSSPFVSEEKDSGCFPKGHNRRF